MKTKARIEDQANLYEQLIEEVKGLRAKAAELGKLKAERERFRNLMIQTNKRLQETTQELSMAKCHLETRAKELEKAQETLELQVKERTADLATANEQLRREIRQRKNADKALRASEANFRKVIVANPDGVVVVDKNGVVQFVNPAVEILFGRKADQLVGELFGFPVTAGEIGEIDIIRSDGGHGVGEMRIAEIEWESRPGYLVSIRDTTQRKRSEHIQRQLLKQLKQTNQKLKDFAHIVCHDLKAPLCGIHRLATWIASDYADKFDENGKKQISSLLTRVDRMHNLIDGVLKYCKVEHAEERMVPMNLSELVSDVIDMIAPPENITITIESQLPTIECEQTQIRQVFQNLLSNAVKYMDKPQGRIRIDCAEERNFWKFSVADNGPGIEEKYFDKIFQMFQTLSPRDEFESTGIGLTMVKNIVEQNKGKIWLKSKPGEGSTFFFTLPKQKMGVKDAKRRASVAH